MVCLLDLVSHFVGIYYFDFSYFHENMSEAFQHLYQSKYKSLFVKIRQPRLLISKDSDKIEADKGGSPGIHKQYAKKK
jgi:hypothetical protein